MRDAPRKLMALACILGLSACPARAEPPVEPARAATTSPRSRAHTPDSDAGIAFAAALKAEAARPLPLLPAAARAPSSIRLRAFGVPPFADHDDPEGQLRALRHLRFLRLWDDSSVSVFVGFNRAGLPGLHFQQRDPADLPPSPPGTVSSDLPLLRQILPRAP